MSDFVVSARKYRPQTFDTVVGQKSITSTLKNAIKNKHLAQAFLFCGSRGVGKTTTARILAKTINCFNRTEQIEACDTCESCISFNSGASLNVYELDAASNNSVDDIRELVNQVRISPQIGTHKVYIIDEVHMLSNSAFNAFLKTLEEPPAHAIFILATTEKHKIIPTILSRCQIFDFQRIKIKDIADHLSYIAVKEGISADSEALHLIAQKAEGALRDALSIFDQIVSFAGNNLTYQAVLENLNILDYDYYFRIVDNSIKEDIPSCLLLFNDIQEKGFDGHNFIVGLSDHFRNLLVCKDVRTAKLLEVGESVENKYIEQSKQLEVPFILRALGVLSKSDVEYKASKNQRLLVELAIMQICSIKNELEKKKSLTDFVEIINFPGQEDKNTPKQPIPKQENTSSYATLSFKKEAKTLTTPTGNFQSTMISIKEITQKKEQNDGDTYESHENKPQNNFTLDDLKIHWRKFAYKMKEDGNDTIYLAMKKRDPKVTADNQVIHEVDNQVQIDYIQTHLGELVDYLRESLRNWSIKVSFSITESEEENIQLQTGKDKFNALARKNPNLYTLQKTFNLDIEY